VHLIVVVVVLLFVTMRLKLLQLHRVQGFQIFCHVIEENIDQVPNAVFAEQLESHELDGFGLRILLISEVGQLNQVEPRILITFCQLTFVPCFTPPLVSSSRALIFTAFLAIVVVFIVCYLDSLDTGIASRESCCYRPLIQQMLLQDVVF
jgi:hypothetical protein